MIIIIIILINNNNNNISSNLIKQYKIDIYTHTNTHMMMNIALITLLRETSFCSFYCLWLLLLLLLNRGVFSFSLVVATTNLINYIYIDAFRIVIFF